MESGLVRDKGRGRGRERAVGEEWTLSGPFGAEVVEWERGCKEEGNRSACSGVLSDLQTRPRRLPRFLERADLFTSSRAYKIQDTDDPGTQLSRAIMVRRVAGLDGAASLVSNRNSSVCCSKVCSSR
jgi:hypothetical protein